MKKLKKLFAISLSLITMLSVPTFAQNNSSKQYETSHDYNNFPFSNGTNVTLKITLSKNQPYGKAFYYNASPYDAKLYVEGKDLVIIKPYSSGSIVWKKSFFKNEYDISITATKDFLNGSFSLAKSESELGFQN